MTITPKYLSGSVSGQAITIAGTTISTSTLLHTSTAVANNMDNIHLTLSNTGATNQTVVLQWGSSANPQNITVSSSGIVSVPFAFLAGGLSLSAFCAAANTMFVSGRVYIEGP